MSVTTTRNVTQNQVVGANAVKLNVLETGNSAGPCVLFIHGFSQSAWAWEHQLGGELAKTHRLLAMDIRGHGESGKPLELEDYTDSQVWADDIAAVIAHSGAQKVMLVGWSYGGFIICDYLRKYGQDKLSGLVFVGAATKMGTAEAMSMLGSKLTQHVPAFFGNDTTQSIAAISQFVRDCFAVAPSIQDFYRIYGYNMVVPPAVRQGLFSRQLDNDDVLATITVPTVVVHGNADEIVLPASGEHIQSLIAHAKLCMLPGVGHCPFSEAPETFDDVIRSV